MAAGDPDDIGGASRRGVLAAIGAAAGALVLPGLARAAGFDPAAYRGKVVYLDFWASWCGPCKQSFPFMQALAARHAAEGLAVVTVNVDRQRAAADAFLRQAGGNLPVIWDSAGDLAKAWKVADMPTSLLFDRAGTMRFRHQGFFPGKTAEYEAHVAALLRGH